MRSKHAAKSPRSATGCGCTTRYVQSTAPAVHWPDELTLRLRPQGTLYSSCKKFDSSVDRNEPFEFRLGAGEVIKGWDNGLVGMCEGEKRKLTIPSDLGYGSAGAGADIHGGATLQFEVELMGL